MRKDHGSVPAFSKENARTAGRTNFSRRKRICGEVRIKIFRFGLGRRVVEDRAKKDGNKSVESRDGGRVSLCVVWRGRSYVVSRRP